MKYRARYVMEVESVFEFEADSMEDARRITQDPYFPEGCIDVEEKENVLYMSETTIQELE
tara:strand:- start:320 stop:499 length:180 start_codon:yes stop_codon:yes gene_type:complete